MDQTPDSSGLETRATYLRVPRTARLSWTGSDVRECTELWVLLHGYGQLADEMLEATAALCQSGRTLLAPEALSRFLRPSS